MTPRLSILIADDDRLLRESLREALGDLLHDDSGVVTADCGGQAIEVLRGRRCDLLFSDVDMPDMTGFQLLAWVSEHQPGPPVVLMSARADGLLANRAREAGAVELLAKPVEIRRIAGIVHRLFPG